MKVAAAGGHVVAAGTVADAAVDYTTVAASSTAVTVAAAAAALAAIGSVAHSIVAPAVAAEVLYHRTCHGRSGSDLVQHFDLYVLRPALPDHYLWA